MGTVTFRYPVIGLGVEGTRTKEVTFHPYYCERDRLRTPSNVPSLLSTLSDKLSYFADVLTLITFETRFF